MLALVAACGGSGDDAADDDTSATTSPPAGPQIPDSFPDDVPLPEFVVLEEANELVAATTIYDITGWHDGTPVVLGEAYLSSLRDAGFEVTSRSDAPTSILFVVERGDVFVSAGFYPDPVRNSGTSIGLTVGPTGDGAEPGDAESEDAETGDRAAA